MRALIADVDDTICPSTQPVSPEMARAIESVVKSGKIFAFISGSTLDQISAQLGALQVEHHLLGASGTQYAVAGPSGRREVYRQSFSPEERREVLEAFEELIAVFDIRTLTTKEDQLQDRGSQITLSALGRGAPEEKKRALDPDGKLREKWVAHLRKRLGNRYSIRIGGTSSIDVTARGIDKAWGIRKFLEHNQIRADEALFLGDKLGPGGNDFPARQVVDCVEVADPQEALRFLQSLRLKSEA